MKQFRYLLMAVVALCFTASLHAQTKTSKKTKTVKHTQVTKYACPMKCEGDKTYAKAGKCPECNMDLKALPATATASYQCPMKCEGDKTYAKEGKCPKCNMKLAKLDTKKKADSHEGHKHR